MSGGYRDIWARATATGFLLGGLGHGEVNVSWQGGTAKLSGSDFSTDDYLFWIEVEGQQVSNPLVWLGIACGRSPAAGPVSWLGDRLVFLAEADGCYRTPPNSEGLSNGTRWWGVAENGRVAWETVHPPMRLSIGNSNLLVMTWYGPMKFNGTTIGAGGINTYSARISDDGNLADLRHVEVDPSCLDESGIPQVQEGVARSWALACGGSSRLVIEVHNEDGSLLDRFNARTYPAHLGPPQARAVWVTKLFAPPGAGEYLVKYRLEPKGLADA